MLEDMKTWLEMSFSSEVNFVDIVWDSFGIWTGAGG